MGLKYIGTDPNTDWLPGVPRRDIFNEEEALYPVAAVSALYEKADLPSPTTTDEDTSTDEPPVEEPDEEE